MPLRLLRRSGRQRAEAATAPRQSALCQGNWAHTRDFVLAVLACPIAPAGVPVAPGVITPSVS